MTPSGLWSAGVGEWAPQQHARRQALLKVARLKAPFVFVRHGAAYNTTFHVRLDTRNGLQPFALMNHFLEHATDLGVPQGLHADLHTMKGQLSQWTSCSAMTLL